MQPSAPSMRKQSVWSSSTRRSRRSCSQRTSAGSQVNTLQRGARLLSLLSTVFTPLLESDADVRQAKDEAKQCYDHLVVAKRHAEEFQASVGGALAAREGKLQLQQVLCSVCRLPFRYELCHLAHRNAMHIAMLEIRELDAWSRHQRALNKLGARPAYDARLRAANALIQAEGNMGRYLANGGSLGKLDASFNR